MAEKNVSVRLTAEVTNYISGMRQAASASNQMTKAAQTDFGKVGMSMQNMGRALLPISAGLTAAGGAAVAMAKDFNSSFTQMQSLAGVSAQEIDGLKDAVKGLAGETGRAPQELADALYFLRSSGLDATQAMDALEVSAQASAVGLGNTATIADAVSSAMNAYATSGMDAARATDVLVATARAGKAEPEQLAQSLGKVLPIASELGVTFEDVGASIAALSLSGNDAAQASTLLTNVLSKLLKPSQQGAEALREVGLSIQDVQASIGQVGLLGTLDMLKDRLGDAGFVKFMEDAQAVQGVLALTGQNAERVRDVFAEVNNSAGSMSDAFQKWVDGPGAGMAQAWAEIQTAMLEAGEKILPMVADVAGVVGDLAGAFNALPDPVSDAVVKLGAFVALGAPFLIAGGKMVSALQNVQRQAALTDAALSRGTLGGLLGGRVAGAAGAALPWALAYGAEFMLLPEGGEGPPSGVMPTQKGVAQGAGMVWTQAKRLATFQDLRQWVFGGGGGRPESADPLVALIEQIGAEARLNNLDAGMRSRVLSAQAGTGAVTSAAVSPVNMVGSTRAETAAAADEMARHVAALDKMSGAYVEAQRAAMAYNDVVAGMDWGRAAVEGATAGMSKFNTELFGLTNIAMQTEAAYDNLDAAIEENGFTFDVTTEKGRANQAALQDLAGALESQFVAAYDNANGSMEAFMTAADGIGVSVIGMLRDMGLSEAQALELAAALGLTEGDYEARFHLSGDEEAKVKLGLLGDVLSLLQEDVQREVAMRIATGDFQGALDLVQANIDETPTEWNTDFQATDNASGTADAVGRAVRSVPTSWNTTFTVNTIRQTIDTGVYVAPGGGRFEADGGINLRHALDGRLDVAKVLPPGPTLYGWREPETGGEAFIPLAASKRARSLAIWEQVGQMFGVLSPFSTGGAGEMVRVAVPVQLTLDGKVIEERMVVTAGRVLRERDRSMAAGSRFG